VLRERASEQLHEAEAEAAAASTLAEERGRKRLGAAERRAR